MAYCAYTDLESINKKTFTAAEQTSVTAVIVIASDMINMWLGVDTDISPTPRGIKAHCILLTQFLLNQGNRNVNQSGAVTGQETQGAIRTYETEIPKYIENGVKEYLKFRNWACYDF